ncbi:hypothetical protein GCM10027047_05930 [Rhodococcus aerolatus]
MAAGIYVETRVHADDDTLWHRTQDADQHTRWDLRFTTIADVTAQTADAPRTFRYDLRLPGLTISGTGTTVGERRRPDGTLTSALRFGSPHPLSLVRSGSGWWRYVPTDDGTRFLTGFDYEPGWAALGPLVDRAGFRAAVGWGTAWSFDRLRLWLDDGVAPETAARRWLADTGLRAAALAVGAHRRGLLGVVLAAAAVLAPAAPGVPRARRCLRTPPDRLARTPPSTMEQL